MITYSQIVAAMTYLGWNQTKLGNAAGVSQSEVSREFARLRGEENKTMQRLVEAIEKAGIEFTEDGGVRPRKEGEHG